MRRSQCAAAIRDFLVCDQLNPRHITAENAGCLLPVLCAKEGAPGERDYLAARLVGFSLGADLDGRGAVPKLAEWYATCRRECPNPWAPGALLLGPGQTRSCCRDSRSSSSSQNRRDAAAALVRAETSAAAHTESAADRQMEVAPGVGILGSDRTHFGSRGFDYMEQSEQHNHGNRASGSGPCRRREVNGLC